MNRLNGHPSSRHSLMTHIVAGYPDLETSERLAELMDSKGVSFIEIQIPFSDPIADGPTIMKANTFSLDRGVTPEMCFDLMERLTKKVTVPLLFMTYFNIVHRMGVDTFCRRAKEVGTYGLIVPDIPIDEERQEQYLAACGQHGLHAIQVVSPLTPEHRLADIAKVASGFVYCVSRTATTGVKETVDDGIADYLARVRRHVKIPLALGFGISNRDQVEEALLHADMAVMGSKVIDVMDGVRPDRRLEAVSEFLDSVL